MGRQVGPAGDRVPPARWGGAHGSMIVLAVAALGVARPDAASAQGPQTEPTATFDLVLRPVREGGEEVTAIEVRSDLNGVADMPDGFGVRAPVVYAGVPGIADRVRSLEVRDSMGAVPLRVEDDPAAPGGFPYFRHWRATRAVRGPIAISYRSEVQPPGSPDGPPFGIRPSGGGVSGAGSGFLVLPEIDDDVTSHVRWDLSDLAPGSLGRTSRGEGTVTVTGSPYALTQLWYLAGPAGTYPPNGDGEGFSAAWLGTPPFDVEAAMAWSAEMHRYLAAYFGDRDGVPPYRVFMRFLETPPYGGGTALGGSFMLSRGLGEPGTVEDAPRSTLVHEMIHGWVGGIAAPQGVVSWFTEGLTTHYTRLLPMRGGYETVEAYGRDLNEAFARYFTSPARNLSADSITSLGFTDPVARRVPYLRGSLYFADLDARIRAASGGTRTLDLMLRDLFRRRAEGVAIDHDAWIAAVGAETGSDERTLFESVILGGATIVPRSDAFGPCFERREARLDGAGGSVDGFAWVRVDGLPASRCRSW